MRFDRRPDAEVRVRRAWREGAGPGLVAASALFGAAADARRLLYDSGVLVGRPPPLPTVGVGSLTVGGSGKTPLSSLAARWMLRRGVRPAVVTHGFPDEVAVHRRLCPEAVVVGRPRRREALEAAREAGAGAAVLDDAFQHLEVRRDLDWVTVDPRAARAGRWRRLPAGPARERWGALERADAVVGIVRERPVPPASAPPRAVWRRWTDRLRRQLPGVPVALCRLRHMGLRPANAAAREREEARPAVGFATIMYGEEFLDGLRARHPTLEREYLFRDHARLDDGTVEELLAAAGDGGLAGTLKDVVKIADRAGRRTPVWEAGEDLVWVEGRRTLRKQLFSILEEA